MDKNVQINGITIDKEKLWTKNKVLTLLELKPNYSSLFQIIKEYNEKLGNEFIWQYSVAFGMYAGIFIVPVQDGFLSIPYNEIEAKQGEVLILDKVKLLDIVSLQLLIEDFKRHSDDLLGALNDMKKIAEQPDITEKANSVEIQKVMIKGMFGGFPK